MKSIAAAASLAGCVTLLAAPLHAQTYNTLAQSRRAAGESGLTVQVKFGAGNFTLRPADNQTLYRATLVYDDDNFNGDLSYDPSSHLLVGAVSGRGHDHNVEYRRGTKQRMDLAIGTAVPLNLTLAFGAGDATLDLGGLRLEHGNITTGATRTRISYSTPNPGTCNELSLSAGAADFRALELGNARCRSVRVTAGVGDITLGLTGAWNPGTTSAVRVEMGLGSLTLRLPQDVGIRLHVQRFLASVDRSGFQRRGGDYYTANYDSAATRITLDLHATLGTVDIDWIGQ